MATAVAALTILAAFSFYIDPRVVFVRELSCLSVSPSTCLFPPTVLFWSSGCARRVVVLFQARIFTEKLLFVVALVRNIYHDSGG